MLALQTGLFVYLAVVFIVGAVIGGLVGYVTGRNIAFQNMPEPERVEVEVPMPTGWFHESVALKDGRKLGVVELKDSTYRPAIKPAGSDQHQLAGIDSNVYDEQDVVGNKCAAWSLLPTGGTGRTAYVWRKDYSVGRVVRTSHVSPYSN